MTATITRTMLNKDASCVIKRTKTLHEDFDAKYEVRGDAVTVEISDDLITAEGAELLSELVTEMLQKAFRGKERLVLVHGGK